MSVYSEIRLTFCLQNSWTLKFDFEKFDRRTFLFTFFCQLCTPRSAPTNNPENGCHSNLYRLIFWWNLNILSIWWMDNILKLRLPFIICLIKHNILSSPVSVALMMATEASIFCIGFFDLPLWKSFKIFSLFHSSFEIVQLF